MEGRCDVVERDGMVLRSSGVVAMVELVDDEWNGVNAL